MVAAQADQEDDDEVSDVEELADDIAVRKGVCWQKPSLILKEESFSYITSLILKHDHHYEVLVSMVGSTTDHSKQPLLTS